MAGVRSGISGWVIGLLIRGRAGAERRAANQDKQGDCQSIAPAQFNEKSKSKRTLKRRQLDCVELNNYAVKETVEL